MGTWTIFFEYNCNFVSTSQILFAVFANISNFLIGVDRYSRQINELFPQRERRSKFLIMGMKPERPGKDLKVTFMVPWSKSKVSFKTEAAHQKLMKLHCVSAMCLFKQKEIHSLLPFFT